MCALCGNPGLVHDGPGAPPSADGGRPGGSFAQPAPDIIETADAANGTGTTYNASVNQVIRGQLGSATDHDWYRVNLVAGQTYTFAMVGTGIIDLRDPELFLRDGSGNLITSNDDGGPGLSSTITYTATATGTYYLDAAAWNNSGSGQYGLSITQGNRAHYDLAMGGGAVDADFSWSATPGTDATVTYGFRQSAPPYSVQGSATQTTFSQLTAQEIAAAQLALQLWSDVANITFTQVNPGGYTDNATILFSNYSDPNDGAGAFAFYPGSTASTDAAGDVYLNTTSVSTSSLPLGSYSSFAIMHEIGHTLGLSHPGDYNAAPGQTITYANNAQFIEDSQHYSVMSYFDDGNTGGNAGSYPDTPLLLDIYALQQIYGANMTTRTGNTIYGFGSNAGALYDFAINSDPILCIWDAGGNDTLDCSDFGQNQFINLTDGLFSNIGGLTGNVSIALGATIENAVGGSGSDTINGNSANNILVGEMGDDTINFSSLLSNNTVVRNGVVTIVSGPDGTDHLTSIETMHFSNTDLHNLFFTGDFNGDGNNDIALQNGNVTAIWMMHGTAIGAGSGNVGGALGTGWFVLGAGDFNGNGTDDFLLQNGQQLSLWQMNGTQMSAGSGNIGTLGADWYVTGLCDLTGDGRCDLVLQNGQQLALWAMNGTQLAAGNIGTLAAGWSVAGTGDFDGDGRGALLLQNGQQLALWEMNGTAIVGGGNIGALGASWMVAGVADVNDDNRADILLQNGQQVAVWEMIGTSIIGGGNIGTLGAGWAVAGQGDFNHDGYADLLLQNGQQIAEWLLNGTAIIGGSGGVGTLGTEWQLL